MRPSVAAARGENMKGDRLLKPAYDACLSEERLQENHKLEKTLTAKIFIKACTKFAMLNKREENNEKKE
jgi:hypothetical protein